MKTDAVAYFDFAPSSHNKCPRMRVFKTKATAAVKFILVCLDFDYDPVCLPFFFFLP